MNELPEGVAGEVQPLARPDVVQVDVADHAGAPLNAPPFDSPRRETAEAEAEADDRGPPPYSCGIFALRLLVPQLWFALWVVFLGLACYGTTQGQPTFAGEVVSVTVGPACVMPPPPPPARETEVDACGIASKPPGPLGPFIRTTSSVDYREALAPEKANDASFGVAPVRFHWEIFATTRNATCKEAAAAGTVGRVAPCRYLMPECTVHFFAGELFLT